MEILLVKCPHCRNENDLGEKVARAYSVSFAFSLHRICLVCGSFFEEADTQESDYRILDKEKEVTGWLRLLLDYAEGRKKWDTAGIWVCEKHPLLPFEQGLTFDCKCGGPGMPPFTPSEDLWHAVNQEE